MLTITTTEHVARYPDGDPAIGLAPGSELACRCPQGRDHNVYVVPVDPADATICESCE